MPLLSEELGGGGGGRLAAVTLPNGVDEEVMTAGGESEVDRNEGIRSA